MVWVSISLLIVVIFFSFQKGKTEDNNVIESKLEWKKLSSKDDTLHLHWLRTLNPLVRQTDGDVIWSTSRQRGMMRFVGLPKLKGKQQYYLWIYDLQQSSEKPIPAGVFKGKKEKEETYMFFSPKEKIIQPFKFLLTIGQKGDVTFTKSQSLLLAQP